MRNSLRILKQSKFVLSLLGLSTHAPICQIPCFKPGTMDAAFLQWSDKGLTTIKDLYINNYLLSCRLNLVSHPVTLKVCPNNTVFTNL